MINNLDTKICKKCRIEKPLDKFIVVNKTSGPYRVPQCKDCKSDYDDLRRIKLKENSEYVRKERERVRLTYHRLYKGTDAAKISSETKKLINQNYKEKYPEKHIARVKAAHLQPIIEDNNLHHWSYNEEHYKDVIEMTKHQHYVIHRYIKYDQTEMKYRTLEGILLNTKEEHYNYIS